MRVGPTCFLPVLCSLPLALGGCGGDDNNGQATDGGVEAAPDGSREGSIGNDASLSNDAGLDAATADTSLGADADADAGDAATGEAGDAADGRASDGGSGLEGGDAALVDAAAETTFVRFAALSPNAPAVDFCLQQRVATGGEPLPWLGPMRRTSGMTSGFSYPQVGGYQGLPPEAYDVRIVGAGAVNCDTPLPGSAPFTGLPRLNAGEHTTIVLAGNNGADATPGLDMQGYRDDDAPTPGRAELRIIHAAPGTAAVDVGLSTGESFTALTTYLSYLSFSRGADFDFNGYLLTTPISGQTMTLKASSNGAPLLTVPGFALPADSIRTAFAIGKEGSASTPLQILLCDDLSAGPTTNCTRLP